jgi:hypothetical protein
MATLRREHYLIDASPTVAQLPPNHPHLSFFVNGFPVKRHTNAWFSNNPHLHPINYPLWGLRTAYPPYAGSPNARPNALSLSSDKGWWQDTAFTLDCKLAPCGDGIPVFTTAELAWNGSLRLGPCFYHGVRGEQDCPHEGRVIPIRVGLAAATLTSDTLRAYCPEPGQGAR